jgi:hypothetical protein
MSTTPSVADLRTAIDTLTSLNDIDCFAADHFNDAIDYLNTLLVETCPHDRLATGPQCMDCGAILTEAQP